MKLRHKTLEDALAKEKVVNFEMDIELWQRFKANCAINRRTIKSVLVKLIKEHLGEKTTVF